MPRERGSLLSLGAEDGKSNQQRRRPTGAAQGSSAVAGDPRQAEDFTDGRADAVPPGAREFRPQFSQRGILTKGRRRQGSLQTKSILGDKEADAAEAGSAWRKNFRPSLCRPVSRSPELASTRQPGRKTAARIVFW